MKYSPKLYAQAFLAAVAEAPEKTSELIRRFVSVVQKNGDDRGWPKILKDLEKFTVKREGGRLVEVTSARPLSDIHLREIKRALSARDKIENDVDPRLVAGVKIVIDGEWTIDATLKGRLQKLLV